MDLWIKILSFYLIFFIGFLVGVLGLEKINFKVFDEIYFIEQAYNYFEKKDYFDGHPPLAKIFYAFLFYLWGKENYFPVRVCWLIISSLLGPLVFLWVLEKTKDYSWSFLAGFLVNIESFTLFFRKFLLLEIPWLVLSFLALYFLARKKYYLFFIFAGLGLSTKWFSLFFLFPFALIELQNLPLKKIITGFILMLIVYFLIFEIHFLLINNKFKIYFVDFLKYNLIMLVAHQSYPSYSILLSTFVLGWPFGVKPISYMQIYAFPNILIFWLIVIAIIYSLFRFNRLPLFLQYLILGYLFYFIVIFFIEILRPGWIYFYLGSLILGMIILSFFLKKNFYYLIPLTFFSAFLLPATSYTQFLGIEKIIFQKLDSFLSDLDIFFRNLGILLGFRWF